MADFDFTLSINLYSFKNRIHLDSGYKSLKKRHKNYSWAGSIALDEQHFCQKRHQTYFAKQAFQNDYLRYRSCLWFTVFTDSSGGLYNALFGRFSLGFLYRGIFVHFQLPSWDSSYYPLMMSQNIVYREYLNAKWAMITIATMASTVLGVLYHLRLGCLCSNSHRCNLQYWHQWALGFAFRGVYQITRDLTSTKKPFGDKQAFNAKTLLLILPKLFLPMILYFIETIRRRMGGLLDIAFTGLLGFFLKDKVLTGLKPVEKYKTLETYKQTL